MNPGSTRVTRPSAEERVPIDLKGNIIGYHLKKNQPSHGHKSMVKNRNFEIPFINLYLAHLKNWMYSVDFLAPTWAL